MRSALKHDARVRTELLKFWRVYDKDQEGHISKAEYLNVHAKLCLVLIPDITPQEARGAGEEDWVADAHGEPHMSQEHLFDCVFELSDMWCTGISAEEYAAFLRKLFKRVTVKSVTKTNGAVVTAAPSTPSKGRLAEYRSFREKRASQMSKGQLIGTPAVLAGVVVPEGVVVAEGEEGAPAPDAAAEAAEAEAAEAEAAAVVSSEEEDEDEETRDVVSYAWAADSQLYPMVLFEKGDIDWAQFGEASSPGPQSPPPLSAAKSAAKRASYLASLSVSVPDGAEEAVTGGPSAAVLLVQPRTPMIQRQPSVKTPKKPKPAPPPAEVAEAPPAEEPAAEPAEAEPAAEPTEEEAEAAAAAAAAAEAEAEAAARQLPPAAARARWLRSARRRRWSTQARHAPCCAPCAPRRSIAAVTTSRSVVAATAAWVRSDARRRRCSAYVPPPRCLCSVAAPPRARSRRRCSRRPRTASQP